MDCRRRAQHLSMRSFISGCGDVREPPSRAFQLFLTFFFRPYLFKCAFGGGEQWVLGWTAILLFWQTWKSKHANPNGQMSTGYHTYRLACSHAEKLRRVRCALAWLVSWAERGLCRLEICRERDENWHGGAGWRCGGLLILGDMQGRRQLTWRGCGSSGGWTDGW